MQISDEVKKILENESRSVVLATADKSGAVNIAMFGSMQVVDDSNMLIMLGDNRTYANVSVNHSAACIVTIGGTSGMGVQGCRLYLKVNETADDGEEFESVKAKLKEKIGDAAEMLKHLVKFEIVEARPILDMGQGI